MAGTYKCDKCGLELPTTVTNHVCKTKATKGIRKMAEDSRQAAVNKAFANRGESQTKLPNEKFAVNTVHIPSLKGSPGSKELAKESIAEGIAMLTECLNPKISTQMTAELHEAYMHNLVEKTLERLKKALDSL
jgi:hypothetical protein